MTLRLHSEGVGMLFAVEMAKAIADMRQSAGLSSVRSWSLCSPASSDSSRVSYHWSNIPLNLSKPSSLPSSCSCAAT